MKKIWTVCLALFLLPLFALPAGAFDQEEQQIQQEWREQMQQGIDEQLQTLDLSSLEEALSRLDPSSQDSLNSYSVRQMIQDIASGEMPFSAGDILSMLGRL
ncbi:MAG: hypothetical protein ACOYI4_09430, partial [Christensenellales bacterium]